MCRDSTRGDRDGLGGMEDKANTAGTPGTLRMLLDRWAVGDGVGSLSLLKRRSEEGDNLLREDGLPLTDRPLRNVDVVWGAAVSGTYGKRGQQANASQVGQRTDTRRVLRECV